jgi:hypothetical protein
MKDLGEDAILGSVCFAKIFRLLAKTKLYGCFDEPSFDSLIR